VTHPRAPRSKLERIRQTQPRRVHDLVVASVIEGEISAASVLVEERLVHDLDASRNAVREALQSLAVEGVLTRERRVGTTVVGGFVKIGVDDASPSSGEPVVQRVVDVHRMPATSMLRRLLELDDSEHDVRMVENLFVDGSQVIGVRSAYYSCRYRSSDYPESAVMPAVVEAYFGAQLGSVRTSLGATLADARTARVLEVRPASPVVFRQQLFIDTDGRPIQLVFDHYRADRVLITSESTIPLP
jgi:GntR family transcriptional regulator